MYIYLIKKQVKKIIISLLFFSYLSGCKKSSKNCTEAVVTLTASSCNGVGVIIGGTKFASDNLPAQYAVEGKKICILYSFWDDTATCSCCGGTKVSIIAVH